MALKIQVPYQEKEQAKAKGAIWDNDLKSWIVPKSRDYNDFKKWINPDEFSIIAHAPFYLAINTRTCWKCHKKTTLVSLASNSFLIWDYAEDEEGNEEEGWFLQDYLSFFSFPTKINKESLALITHKYPFFKLGYSNTTKSSYWANHCEHCNALQGDYFNHNDGGAFNPMSIDQCGQITLIKVPSKLDLTVNAGYSWSSLSYEMFRYAQKRPWDENEIKIEENQNPIIPDVRPTGIFTKIWDFLKNIFS